MRLVDRLLSRFGYVSEDRAKVHATAYAGAMANRLTQDWIFAAQRSGDQDIRGDHQRITARAREMARNDAHAKRFLGLLHQNVVGPRGVKFQSRAKAPDGKFDRALTQKVEAAWNEWRKPENASVDGRSSFADIERMVVRGEARDGEALVRLVPGFQNPFRFSLQVLDPDLLDVTFERAASKGQNEIRMGVEIDGWGRPVAYHLWDGHPSEHGRDRNRTRIPADQIIHLFLAERPGQTRAVTWFAPVMMTTRMLGGYREAELVAARIAAAKMGFFESTEEGGGILDPNGNAGSVSDFEMDVEPGKLGMAPDGYHFAAWDPQHPTSAYDAFEKAMLRTIGAGLEVSYPSLTGDLSDVNYSSIRAGKLDERDVYRWLQYRLTQHLHARVFPAWLRWAFTAGALDISMEEYRRAADHEWQPRGWDWVDPEKDIDAAIKARGAGMDSLTRIVASQGRDIEETFEQIQRENEMAEEYGVELNLDTRARGPAPAQPASSGNGNGRALARTHPVVPVGAGDWVRDRVNGNGGSE